MKKKITRLMMAALLSISALPSFGQAEIQIIHNAADPSADSVDVYVNGTLTLNDFKFRSATSFLTVPSGVVLNIGVAPGNSASVTDTVKNFPVTLMMGQRYVAIANGVLAPANFAVNPDSRATGFTLFIKDNVRNAAVNPGEVDFIALHGATDAPTVDVIARNVATLVNNAAYGDITPYISVPAASYILDVTPAAGSPIVASFQANLSSLGGGSAVVFASGFLTPSANQFGPAFGLFAALANGTVVAFPGISQARLQVIHNAADPSADTVDVYVNGALLLNNFVFRKATPFIDVPAGDTLNIGIAGKSSTSVNDTIVNIPVVLANGQTYVAIASGVLTPANFAVNPNAINTGFKLLVASSVRESGQTPGSVDFMALHGATDAPTVDVIARNVATLVNNASYTDITPYITVPAASYILDVTPAAGSPIVASFQANLSSLGGGSAVVFASGFLTPSANQFGPAFGLFAALANGTVVEFPAVSIGRVQIIHNAADPSADSVDIYLNGSLLINNFAFRTATAFQNLPAGAMLNIGVAGKNSTSINDTLVNFQVMLANGGEYIAVANGVLTPANFAANPDALSTGFTLFLQDQMRESAVNPSDVDLRVVHGATDAPTVDVLAGASILVDSAAYSNITPYLAVPAASYILNITPNNNNAMIVASFAAPLTSLAGQSAVVLASGFLNPATNQNGAAFGLIAVLVDGTVIVLSNVTGIDEKTGSSNYNIYPNPAKESINITLENNSIKSIVEISNSLGQVIKTKEMNGSSISIPVNELTKGLYFVRVKTDAVNSVSKLIVE